MSDPTGDYPAIRALLRRSESYPNAQASGFGMNRDGLIALLNECTPSLESISVIPAHDDTDMTSFAITVYVGFARSEMHDGGSDE